MFNRNRQPPQPRPKQGQAIKLPQLWNTPEFDHINDILAKAQKNPDTIVEQMWSVEGMDKMFVLNVKVDDEGDPLWVLKESKITDTRLLWEHRSRDTALIHTLIVGECTGEVQSEAKTAGDFSTSINLSVETETVVEATPGSSTGARDITKSSATLPKLDNEDAILQGDLAKIQLPMVLQSIQMGKMTGRLAVRTETQGVDVYFAEGEPQHATDGIDKGNEVILNLVCIQAGKFQFIPDERTVEQSVSNKLDGLLMEAIALVDQSNFLEKEGISDECYLISRHTQMQDQELQSTLSQGLPLDQNVQYDFLRHIGNFEQLGQVLTKKPLKRSEWVPIVFNLVTLGITSISDTPPQESAQNSLVEEKIDFLALESSLKPIQRQETGVLIYPAFQFFLAQECYRNKLCGIPLTLAVFSISLNEADQELSNLDVYQIMECISKMKRPIDILGHFQTFEYAIILPNMGSRAAASVVQKIQSSIPSIVFKSGINGHSVVLDFGIAGIPEHCSELGQIIPAAAQARVRAEGSSSNVAVFENQG